LLKILLAPASYKGSIAAHCLAEAMARGCEDLVRADMHHLYGQFDIIKAPIADGGDDTLASLHLVMGGKLFVAEVLGPTGQTVRAAYLQLAELPPTRATAIIELAQASGIAYLTENQLQPLTAHTYGTGQLIGYAIAGGARQVVVTVGGSASTDGGTGALSALGAKFLDSSGQAVPLGGGSLLQIAEIDLSDLLLATEGVKFIVATDVTSPLVGPEGAAAVFGPQKGASPADVAILDQGLAHYANLVEKYLAEKYHVQRDLAEQEMAAETISAMRLMPGAGAAGGAGFGFAAMLNAPIVSGFHYLSNLLGLEQKIAWCDLIIVAEGRLDRQSLTGKGVGEMIGLALQLGKKVLALPARCQLTAAELAALAAGSAGQIIVLPTAGTGPGGMATLSDVQAATTKALAQFF
jgi:glycerate kinase